MSLTRIIHDHVIAAVNQTFAFRRWHYTNEFEVKHELFYQLSQLAMEGVGLADRVPGSPTCRLHAEGKVLNGRPQKADILICDPFQLQHFNYRVAVLVEIMQVSNPRTAALEIEKFRGYGVVFEGLYLVAPVCSRELTLPKEINGTPVFALHPEIPSSVTEQSPATEPAIDLESAFSLVELSIRQTLEQYGSGRTQFHGFFWCNYEHELWRGHSFPSEGDFNAQLYRRFRERLPTSVAIRSEVHPTNQPTRRVDFVVC